MNVILHIGAHRCATTSFQHFLRHNAAALAARGVGFWGPLRTRGGLLRGVKPGRGATRATHRHAPPEVRDRIRQRVDRSAARGANTLLVSDENMLGSVKANLETGSLYPDAGFHMSLFADAFRGRALAVALNIRAYDTYWASALGYQVARWGTVPGRDCIARLAGCARGWRDVIADLAQAMPNRPLFVLPYETFAGRPAAQFSAMTGLTLPVESTGKVLNATPDLPKLRELAAVSEGTGGVLPKGEGQWQPFLARETERMRGRYAEDLKWLAAGADGLARVPGSAMDGPGGASPMAQGIDKRKTT